MLMTLQLDAKAPHIMRGWAQLLLPCRSNAQDRKTGARKGSLLDADSSSEDAEAMRPITAKYRLVVLCRYSDSVATRTAKPIRRSVREPLSSF